MEAELDVIARLAAEVTRREGGIAAESARLEAAWAELFIGIEELKKSYSALMARSDAAEEAHEAAAEAAALDAAYVIRSNASHAAMTPRSAEQRVSGSARRRARAEAAVAAIVAAATAPPATPRTPRGGGAYLASASATPRTQLLRGSLDATLAQGMRELQAVRALRESLQPARGSPGGATPRR
jgi:ABC-type Na+ efflux pump permease subunit